MLGGETNYFLGNDPARWRTHVKHFAEAAASGVLPGVDMIAYGNAEGVEYDLRVAPGVNTRDLRLEIAVSAGAARSDEFRLDASGDLIMALDGHEIRMKRPAIYEERVATESQPLRRERVDGGYEIEADGSVAFNIGPHDPGATLVIDPSLTVAYTTFLGGAGSDSAQSIALDSAGNVYIGGTTTSAATFTASGTKRLGPSGSSDFFIAKINPSLTGPSSLVYLTFIGGSGAELGGEDRRRREQQRGDRWNQHLDRLSGDGRKHAHAGYGWHGGKRRGRDGNRPDRREARVFDVVRRQRQRGFAQLRRNRNGFWR